jgi:hypothetical protein
VEQQHEPGVSDPNRPVGIARLGIGLLQGIIAWWLLELVPAFNWAINGRPSGVLWWSQQHPMVFATLALVTAFVPVIALAEIGRMQRRRLGIYLATATAVLAVLVAYDIWREPIETTWTSNAVRIWPSAGLVFCAGFGVFIVNQLMEHRTHRHRLFTEYAAHFEDSWMRGFQFFVSLFFTLLVWGVLELGKGLFDLIHLDWFGHMIEHNWFRCPALAFAFAASVHITDVRPALLRGMRNLGLTLLSWLLPLVVVLGCSFLGALFFTGLQPLWSTRFAATILLWATAVTLVLLNAAYKDGDPENLPVLPLRWAGRVAGPMMLVLTVLAIYAIAQRVGQHGWTPQRVRSSSVALVALIYSGGYTWATIASGLWIKRLEKVNVTASLTILAVLVLLLTPIADPARLAVNSQVSRLKAGAIAPGKFDYQFLRFDSGRFGTDALAALARNANADIASRARQAQASDQRTYQSADSPDPATTEPALSHVIVYPHGAVLPADFVPKNLGENARFGPDCLHNGHPCDIVIWNRAAQGSPLLIVHERIDAPRSGSAAAQAAAVAVDGAGNPSSVFGRDAKGNWSQVGHIDHLGCPGVLDALRNGQFASVRPAHDDLQAGSVRLNFTPDATDSACPVAKPARLQPAPASSNDATAPAHMGPAFGNPGG